MISRDEAEALVLREALLLDQGRYEDWLGLFTEDGIYWVPSQPDQPDPRTHVSLFHEDLPLMRTRIGRLRHPAAHTLTVPIRTCHVLGRVTLDEGAGTDRAVARCAFHMLESHGPRQRMFGGFCTHDLVRVDGALRIRRKRVDLINCDQAHEVIEVFI